MREIKTDFFYEDTDQVRYPIFLCQNKNGNWKILKRLPGKQGLSRIKEFKHYRGTKIYEALIALEESLFTAIIQPYPSQKATKFVLSNMGYFGYSRSCFTCKHCDERAQVCEKMEAMTLRLENLDGCCSYWGDM